MLNEHLSYTAASPFSASSATTEPGHKVVIVEILIGAGGGRERCDNGERQPGL